MTMTLSGNTAKGSADWTFVSGKVAALESELLPRAFFDSILKAAGAAEARAALGKSPYRPLFPDDKSLAQVSAVVAARGREVRAEILKLCPPHPLENYFGVAARFRSFRTLFNQMAAQPNPQAGDLDALFPVFAAEPDFDGALTEHRRMLGRKNAPQAASPMERSLYLDSAACTLMAVVAAATPERLARRYMADRAVLAAWSGVFRARANGVPADMIRTWFVFGDSTEFPSAALAAENDPKAVVSGRLSVPSAAALDAADPARVRADIDAVAADVLRETVLDCRFTPFGAERALSYLVAVEAELVNLELCLSAVVNGIDRTATAARLRREYA